MAATSGKLVNQVSSTASSPTVNYSASYTATRASDTAAAISVKLTFLTWLNSSQSRLGTGIKLTVFARINGGAWKSAVLKSTSESWSGTATHSAGLTLTANVAANSTKIEFYVSRTGSSISGTAGTLGSSSSPKSYTAALPAYSTVKYKVIYSVSGDVPSGYTAPTDSTAYTSGATVTVKPVPAVEGYAFAGWMLNGSIVTSFKIAGNVTLTGVWTATEKYVYVDNGKTYEEGTLYGYDAGGTGIKASAVCAYTGEKWESN